MRPSVLLLLPPLWLRAAAIDLRSRPGARPRHRLVIAGFILAGSVLAWLLPMMWLTGGPAADAGASAQRYGSVLLPTAVLGGSLEVTLAQLRYLIESTLVGLGPLSLVALAVPAYARRHGWRGREWFLLVWIVPPAVFYTLVHFGNAGYVLAFLPALVILLSRVLVWAVAAGSERLRRPNWRWALTTAVVLPLVLMNTGFFVSARPLAREFDNRSSDRWFVRARDALRQQ